MARLSGKVAIVTGGSRGIGAAICARLARDGAKVAVNYSRSREAADALVEQIKRAGGDAIALAADLSQPQEIAPLVDATVKAFARLDILVNNAAFSQRRTLEQSDAEHYAQ